MKFRFASQAIAFLLLSLTPFDATATNLVGHRAAYSVALGTVASGANIAAVRGVVFYSFGTACDGWTVENRTRLHFDFTRGGGVESEWFYATYETRDGSFLRFQSRDLRNAVLHEALKGSLRLGPTGGGTAVFDRPPDTTVPVPPETMLPTRHMLELFAEAAAGKTSVTRTVFDGTSLDNPMIVTALIRPGSAAERAAAALAVGMEERPLWHIRSAFFPADSSSPEPIFEMDAQFRDDGITHRIRQDYGDFVLDLRLERIELLPSPDC